MLLEQFTIRADSGFCRRWLLNWCERNAVNYIVGLAKNAGLHALTAPLQAEAAQCFNSENPQISQMDAD